MKNFRNLKVWKQGIEIVKKGYVLSKQLPTEEKFGLVSQLTRAAVSIPSNVAEGSSRKTNKGFHYYLEIALGSAYEVETLLVVIEELELIEKRPLNELVELLTEEQRMLNGLMKINRE